MTYVLCFKSTMPDIADILFLATTLTLFQSRGGRLSIPKALVPTKVSAFSPPDLKMFPLP